MLLLSVKNKIIKSIIMSVKINIETLSKMTLKHRFLYAVSTGALGAVDDRGIIVTAKQFRLYFNDIQGLYTTSFLPAATIEIGQNSISHTKFVFRLSKGIYRVHEDAIEAFIALYQLNHQDKSSKDPINNKKTHISETC